MLYLLLVLVIFFLNRELVLIVRLHIYILLHFTFEFSGGAILIPRPIICSNALSLGHIGRSNGLFPRAFFKKKTLIKLDLLNLEMLFQHNLTAHGFCEPLHYNGIVTN